MLIVHKIIFPTLLPFYDWILHILVLTGLFEFMYKRFFNFVAQGAKTQNKQQ